MSQMFFVWIFDKIMGKLANENFAKLDNIIAEQGKDFVISQVITRIAEGCDPKDIARSFGIHYVYLKRWLENECSEDISLALRARADMLEYDASTIVDAADPDSVQVARLQSEHKMKLASRFDRARYGEKPVQETTVGGLTLPTFLISFIQAPQQPHEKVIIEHEVIEHERIIIAND